jgi:hypothetical protein
MSALRIGRGSVIRLLVGTLAHIDLAFGPVRAVWHYLSNDMPHNAPPLSPSEYAVTQYGCQDYLT